MPVYIQSTISIYSNKVSIKIKNGTGRDIIRPKLCFSLPLAHIDELKGGELIRCLGSYAEIVFEDEEFLESSEWNISFKTASIKHISDAPEGVFLIERTPIEEKKIEVMLSSANIIDYDYIRNPCDEYMKALANNFVEYSPANENMIPIVPHPQRYNRADGTIDAKIGISSLQDTPAEARRTLAQFLKYCEDAGVEPCVKENGRQSIEFLHHEIRREQEYNDAIADEVQDESYVLDISSSGIKIYAGDNAGFFYALITLEHLWLAGNGVLPCAEIIDAPRFLWRGFMLDTVRQFYTVDEIKKILRIMAMHKLNIFHWHITDDEAWRIPLDSYEVLSESMMDVHAFRGYGCKVPPFFASGEKKYGGYYKKEDIREIVHYASDLYIHVMPEFDFPGHSRALLDAIPQLREEEDKSEYTSVQGYNLNSLNPGIEASYDFIKNLLNEYTPLFPFSYIHLGCDELAEGAWEKSPLCKKLMKKENLTSKPQLFDYFVQRVKHLCQNKKSAYWEEALDCGLEARSIIFSWTDTEAGKKAINKGYPVVMCPAQYYYFDIAQSHNPKEIGASWAGKSHVVDTYAYEPVEEGMHDKDILGVQANLWGETLHQKESVEYMIFPRIAALAETAWSQKENKSKDRFFHTVLDSYRKLLGLYSFKGRL